MAIRVRLSGADAVPDQLQTGREWIFFARASTDGSTERPGFFLRLAVKRPLWQRSPARGPLNAPCFRRRKHRDAVNIEACPCRVTGQAKACPFASSQVDRNQGAGSYQSGRGLTPARARLQRSGRETALLHGITREPDADKAADLAALIRSDVSLPSGSPVRCGVRVGA